MEKKVEEGHCSSSVVLQQLQELCVKQMPSHQHSHAGESACYRTLHLELLFHNTITTGSFLFATRKHDLTNVHKLHQ